MEWTIEKLIEEFKRYEKLENEHGVKGDNETAYYYMKKKWEVNEVIANRKAEGLK
jgi:hypothetical protein